MNLLSIIIPYYKNIDNIDVLFASLNKASKYNRILKQIVFVNDGSPDISEKIFKDMINKYEIADVVKYIEIDNSGVSVARNVGLERAVGDYVWFIDSDDVILDKSLLYINEVISLDYDIFEFSYFSKLKSTNKLIDLKEGLYSGNEYLDMSDGRFYLWNKIYKRTALVNNKFIAGLRNIEDFVFNVSLLSRHDLNIKVVNKPIYVYVDNIDSFSRNIDSNKKDILYLDTLIAHCEIEKFIKNEKVKNCLDKSILGLFFSFINLRYHPRYFGIAFREYNKRGLLPIINYKTNNIKEMLFMSIINLISKFY
ncbi:glycosyltransferase [Photobacterium carnosum]|uniref:glycosyltransferase n=1 Tax=Photobacterium carnosum TaxID=2023717 RepID=UPI00242DC566|nr:glycosyltransferase [Photobacterium carnosum]